MEIQCQVIVALRNLNEALWVRKKEQEYIMFKQNDRCSGDRCPSAVFLSDYREQGLIRKVSSVGKGYEPNFR